MIASTARRRARPTVTALATATVIGIAAFAGAAPSSAASHSPALVPDSSVTRWNGATESTPSTATCSDYMFKVSLSPGSPKKYQLFGRLCHQGDVSAKTLQVLLAGGTYNHTYWDFPYQPNKYSYVQHATDAGYATLSIDRLGYGYSSHVDPVGTEFTREGWVVHQVIQEVRSGQLGASFNKVVLVGHSMGSFTSWAEAGRYHDVDGVIITGAEHAVNPVTAIRIAATVTEPAQLDPSGRFATLPVGYLTSLPGTRCGLLFNAPDVDPQLCVVDERTKDTYNTGELPGFPVSVLSTTLSSSINVPVLMADGQFDDFYCLGDCSAPPVAAQERMAYKGTPCYEAYYLPNSGHDVGLHLNSELFDDRAIQWVNARIGVSSTRPATNSCG